MLKYSTRFKKVLGSVPRVSARKVSRRNALTGNGRMWMLGPELKSAGLRNQIVWNLLRPGDLVLDSYSSKLCTTTM